MLSNGFQINESNKCIYIKCTLEEYVIVCLYVGDMLIMGSSSNILKTTKEMLIWHFNIDTRD